MKTQMAKLLLKEQILSLEQVKDAVKKSHDSGLELSEALIELGYITESELLDFLGRSYGVPVISIEEHSVDEEVLKLIPREIAVENRLIPLSITGSALTVAMSDPSNIILADELSFLTEKKIIPVVVSERSIINMLEEYYGYTKDTSGLQLKDSHDNMGFQQTLRDLEEYVRGDTETEPETISAPEEIPEIESNDESAVSFKDNLTEEMSELSDSAQDQSTEDEPDDEEINEDPAIFQEPDYPENESSSKGFEDNEAKDDRPEDEISDPLPSSPVHTLNEDSEDQSFEMIEKEVKETITELESIEPPELKAHTKGKSKNVTHGDQKDQTVLVIDHSRTVQRLIALSLGRKGYSVNAVSDSMEALSRLHDLKPDLIFIEINLPHMDGYRVCKIIKSHGLMKRVPVVMLSGKEGLVDKMRSKMAGANGHLSKPFALNDVVASAQRFTSAVPQSMVSGQD